MTKFSLRVTAENVKVFDLWEPLCFLCFVGKIFDGQAEHGDSKADSWQKTLEVAIIVNIRGSDEWLFKADVFVSLVKLIYSLP